MISLDSRWLRAYVWVFGIGFFFIPGLLLFVHLFFVRGFLPSEAFRSWLVPASVVWATASLPFTGLLFLSSGKLRDRLAVLLLPAFCASMGAGLIGGPVPYLLHVGSNPNLASANERIKGLHECVGSKSCAACPRSVSLSGDASFLRRRICMRGGDTAYTQLHAGDHIQITGSKSRFGFLVQGISKPDSEAPTP